MKKGYDWQENGGEIEVIFQDKNGFTWICDCGLSSHPDSKKMAKLICKALNQYIKEN